MGTIYIAFLLLGLGNGAIFAAIGLGLVVTYRSSGVVNFSTGAVALYVAYTYAFLRQGQFLDPIPGLNPLVNLGTGGLGFFPALLISLCVAGVLGAVLYLAIFRPLRAAPAAAKAVVSVGVMTVITAVLAAQVGTQTISVAPFLPSGVFTILGQRIPQQDIGAPAIIVAVAIALALWFRFTRFGLAARAVAESEEGALVTGLSPQRIALVNWALSTAIAGFGGILVAPFVPLTPESFTLFIVPALAAALVSNFMKIGPTVAAGLIIGMLESLATYLQTKSWLPSSGLSDLVPLIIVLAFLVFRGQVLPSRGAIVQQTLGRAPRPRSLAVPGICIAGAGLATLILTDGSTRAAVITTFVLAIVSLSQVVVTGFSGQISLAQLSLAGVGAFSLTRIQYQLHVPFPLAPLLAAAFAMIIGVVVGLPAVRIRGLPVAVTTLALAVVLENLWFNDTDLDGGMNGSPIKDASIFGLHLGVGTGASYPRISFGVFCLVVMLLVIGGVVLLRRSRLGAAMLAVRANEASAAASGISVARVKLIAFAIGGFIAGLGGAMLAYQQTVANASSYDALSGLALFATVYISGVTSVSGGINAGLLGAGGLFYVLTNNGLPLGVYILLAGGAVVALIGKTWPKLSRPVLAVTLVGAAAAFGLKQGEVSLGNNYNTLTGVFLVITVILNPEGIVGGLHDEVASVRARFAGRFAAFRRAPVEKPAADRIAGAEPSARAHDRDLDGPPLLTVRQLGVRYGSVVANEDVSFDVHDGEIVGLIGPNGAGKTTLMDAIGGYLKCSGSVVLFGHDVNALKPFQRSRAGLGRTFQGIDLYEDLSIQENIRVGTLAARHREDVANMPAFDIDETLRVMGLGGKAETLVRELSVGQRQLVSIARALAGRPRVVLLDEPAAGLDTTESRWLAERLRAIRDAGTTILVIDHDMGLMLELCDRIITLNLGKVIAAGTPAEIRSDPAVAHAYLGTMHAYEEPDTV